VGGTSVAVGGISVAVGGTGVSVGTGVFVGTGVYVRVGSGVAVGTGVFVGAGALVRVGAVVEMISRGRRVRVGCWGVEDGLTAVSDGWGVREATPVGGTVSVGTKTVTTC
jgi:hypothetical protein